VELLAELISLSGSFPVKPRVPRIAARGVTKAPRAVVMHKSETTLSVLIFEAIAVVTALACVGFYTSSLQDAADEQMSSMDPQRASHAVVPIRRVAGRNRPDVL